MAKKNEEVNEETLDKETEKTAEPKEAEKSNEEVLEEKLKEQTDKYMRLYAEYDNYQKRSQREKDMRYGDAVIDTVGAILSIGDNLERALATEVQSEDGQKMKDGIEMVLKQFNEQFDPNLHNAVMHIEDETIDDNTVVEDLMKGYIYKDGRVVRHSMVKVAN